MTDDFGRIMLALAPPADGSAAARFVDDGDATDRGGVMSLDAAGRPSGVAVDGTGLDALLGAPVTAIAPLPGGAAGAAGRADPELGDVLLMSLAPPHATQTFIGTTGRGEYGVGLAAGNIGGGPAPEFVVVSSTSCTSTSTASRPWTRRRRQSAAGDPCPIAIRVDWPRTTA